ncbi:MAG: Asp-tRNA(Asn)/Glu-tRNA(Gln) amidotransferase subunit GatC [Clostridia bacterium]|nr:Asp-tRNA(Asn)/Glu-tRNA(Gln) amidotransferase subunit GatC [Clostridia bacterium]MBR6646212.1 Asp-tRNA(Asn)/Glu-tRNA(Gln) amidotransferase subunit GatC [Clostridia bacterium]
MKITKEEVLHVAKLAKLNLSEEETKKLLTDMESIIEFANTLNELDTEGVVPTAHARPMSNAFREDVVKDSYDREEMLKNAPDSFDGGFAVPKVVE